MHDTNVRFHDDARAEAIAAAEWYADQSPLAATAFLAELDRTVAEVQTAPDRWPKRRDGTQHCLFRRFPYSLVYRSAGNDVHLIAVAHAKRRPGYWKGR